MAVRLPPFCSIFRGRPKYPTFDGYHDAKGQSGSRWRRRFMFGHWGLSALVMMAATEPLANWAIRNVGPPEIFALVFFGLVFASSVGARTIWKGWMSVLIGLLIATIGKIPWAASIATISDDRFGCWHCVYSRNFGVLCRVEIFVQAEKKASGKYRALVSMTFPSFIELWMHKIAVLLHIGWFSADSAGNWRHIGGVRGYGEAVRWSKTVRNSAKKA